MRKILMAQLIGKDSWLNEPGFARLKAGLVYAGTQSVAIPALAAITPEQAAYLFICMTRGVERETDSDSPAKVLGDLLWLIEKERTPARLLMTEEMVARIRFVLAKDEVMRGGG